MNKLIIKKATSDDAIWIFDELGEGAKAGHFSKSLLNDFQRMGMIAQVTIRNELQILKLRNGKATPVVLPADLWVANLQGEPAGFLLALFEGPRERPVAVELHLAGTVSKFRGRGVFSSLIKNQLASASQGIRIYTRCYPQSTVAISVLMSQGFFLSHMGNPIELEISI